MKFISILIAALAGLAIADMGSDAVLTITDPDFDAVPAIVDPDSDAAVRGTPFGMALCAWPNMRGCKTITNLQTRRCCAYS